MKSAALIAIVVTAVISLIVSIIVVARLVSCQPAEDPVPTRASPVHVAMLQTRICVREDGPITR